MAGIYLAESVLSNTRVYKDIQFSQMAVSQHGSLKALMANLLQMAQRSFVGNSSCVRELFEVVG